MNRLQKKCLIATAGGHLLLILVLVFGSAFFVTHTKVPENNQVLDVIPATLVDAAFNSGVKNARPPAPTPIVTPPTPPQPVPLPPQPQPVVTPPPQPQPKPEPVKQPDPEPVKQQKPEPDDEKSPEPTPKPTKPTKPKIAINLNVATRNAPSKADTSAADARREAQKQRQQRLNAINNAISSIKENASTDMTIEMPGNGSVSYANYGSAIKSIYEQAWRPPGNTASDDANTTVSITIRNDGKVITSRIISPSGDAQVDASVQRALDRVTSVPAFPDGAKEKERTFKINFNLKAKRMLG